MMPDKFKQPTKDRLSYAIGQTVSGLLSMILLGGTMLAVLAGFILTAQAPSIGVALFCALVFIFGLPLLIYKLPQMIERWQHGDAARSAAANKSAKVSAPSSQNDNRLEK